MTRIVEFHAGGLGARLAAALGVPLLQPERRRFPDGETYLRLDAPLEGTRAWVVADLSPPDPALLPLLLLARMLRSEGATHVGLVAPYLPYMRQDARFRPGECESARHVAALLSAHFDAVLTVDAHLHRIAALDAVFTVPALNLSAAPLLGEWAAASVGAPLLVGPDIESAQWVERAAHHIGCPWTVLAKERRGDRSVVVSGRLDPAWSARTPVLLDDIVSSGTTLAEAASLLAREGFTGTAAAIVHPVLAGDAAARLTAAGLARIASTDSLPHPSNAIGLCDLLAGGVRELEGRLG